MSSRPAPVSPKQRFYRIVEDGMCIGCGLCQSLAGSGRVRMAKVASGVGRRSDGAQRFEGRRVARKARLRLDALHATLEPEIAARQTEGTRQRIRDGKMDEPAPDE